MIYIAWQITVHVLAFFGVMSFVGIWIEMRDDTNERDDEVWF